jgi:two-component system chemotaxis response regulator CheY
MPQLLLIEDNVELLKVIREAVEIGGYEVVIAHHAEEALGLLHSGLAPSIIMCDIVMPHMSGLEFLSIVRANPAWNQVVFIAMSGTNNSQNSVLRAGANYYLVKPFSFRDLFDILDQVQSGG